MLKSKRLCDEYHECWSIANLLDEPYAAMAYATAEDLADGMLKGLDPEAPAALRRVFQANAAEAENAEERKAWLHAEKLAGELL